MLKKPENTLKKKTIMLLRWHRRLGLALALLVLLLGVTGILINHTADLKLSKISLTHPSVLDWYGLVDKQVNPPPIQHGFHLGKNNWLAASDEGLFLNHSHVTECQLPLLSATANPQFYLALCQQQLILLTPAGEVVETITPAIGLPEQVQAIVFDNDILLLLTQDDITYFDLDTLTATPYTSSVAPKWPVAEKLPASLLNKLASAEQASVSLETLILDIHSGRILGRWGVWLMDITAFLVCLLAISGIWAWYNHKRIVRDKHRRSS